MLLECQALLREQSYYQLLSSLLQHLAFCTLDFKEQVVPSSNPKGEAVQKGRQNMSFGIQFLIPTVYPGACSFHHQSFNLFLCREELIALFAEGFK